MKTLWLWGAGKNLKIVMDYINSDVKIQGIFDKDGTLRGKKVRGIEIVSPQKELITEQDLILITASAYDGILRDAVSILEVSRQRIIPFWNSEYKMEDMEDLIDVRRWKSEIENPYLKLKIKNLEIKLNNQKYEIAEKILNDPPVFPTIRGGAEALEKVYREKKSLCRYGDGEFEIIFGRERADFQKTEKKLGRRLYEILNDENDKVLTCIADFYSSLDAFTENIAMVCREYLTPEVRKEHMSVININKTYYDSYVSRPYIFFKDKSKADKIFLAWKRVWDRKDVVIVEGRYTRCGYKNDLFMGVKSLKRILCPPVNAWNCYDRIFDYIMGNISRNKMILIALGPAATVLAYDLAQAGYHAIDIGHLDNEYEWFLRGCQKMEKVDYKYMDNMGEIGRKVEEISDKEYEDEILKKFDN